nr:ABC transporter ATP-binding protein [uncultured Cohaesibacter sp.]
MSKAENAVEISNITKSFGDVTAIHNISMQVSEGDFVTILGPSGCGKSTLLRMISGFEDPTSGDVRIAGRSVVGLPPYKRDTAMVFQDYALFPHRTVAENIAFGLRMRKMDKAEIARQVDAMLELISLSGFGNRRVSEISGGQAQRVALGRALVVRPSVLLLDEPLGALDMKLRKQMQAELKRIHRELGLTFIAVTHDQEEALTLSDRIAIMNVGHLEQFDTPETLYRQPASQFVADFVGGANLIEATVGDNQMLLVRDAPFKGIGAELVEGRAKGQRLSIVVRPEVVVTDPLEAAERPDHCGLQATVEEVLFSGASLRIVGRLDNGAEFAAHESAQKAVPARGQRLRFSWPSATSWIVDR